MSVSISKAAATLGLVAGFAFAASGPASAFPQPKYSTTLPIAPAPAVASSQLPAAAPNPSNHAASSAPASSKPAAKPVEGSKTWSVYVVQKGDTLSGVSRRFGEPVKTLADLNELDSKAPLKSGLKLKLAPGAVDSGKDPYAGGPSPFVLANGTTSHVAASGTKPKSVRTAEAGPAPSSSAPAHPVASAAKPKPVRTAEAAPTPAASSGSAQRPVAVASRPTPTKEASADTPQQPLKVAVALKVPPAETQTDAAPSNDAPTADPAVTSGRGRFVWPVKGEILSRFGPLAQGERNDGVNISADEGAEVRAAAAGEVVYAGSDVKGFGNVVLIKHPDGWVTAYAHLGSIGVRIRDHVSQGQSIGSVGRSGGVDQPQLHFETRYSAAAHEKHKPVDPLTLLP